MSTLSEIEAAIVNLPAPQLQEFANWFEQHRCQILDASEPDFLGRAAAIWGENPKGELLSKLVSDARD